MIFLISFLHFVICVLKISVSSTDFFSSCVSVFHTHHYDMLFNVIIYILLNCFFLLFEEFLFHVKLLHINSHLFQWIFFLNHSSHFAQFVSVDLWVFLMHLITVFKFTLSLIFLILDAFLRLSSMQVVMLLISDHKWFFALIKMM